MTSMFLDLQDQLIQPHIVSMTPEMASAESVFMTAAKRFQDNLPEDDKPDFQILDTPQEMIASIEQHVMNLNSPRTTRLLDACKKIEQFSKTMTPFFNIVDIFVSSHPDWAAVVWGAIRLVFQVSTSIVLPLYSSPTCMLVE